jgi:hypothetical protein
MPGQMSGVAAGCRETGTYLAHIVRADCLGRAGPEYPARQGNARATSHAAGAGRERKDGVSMAKGVRDEHYATVIARASAHEVYQILTP